LRDYPFNQDPIRGIVWWKLKQGRKSHVIVLNIKIENILFCFLKLTWPVPLAV
jgi:hypothetical protein